MFFLLNIFLIIAFAFYAGMFCAAQKRSSWIWFQGIFIPFFVTIIISLIYQAPWFWFFIQFFLQALAFIFGIRFQKKFPENFK